MKEDVRKISMVKIILRIERQAHKTTFNLLFAQILFASHSSFVCSVRFSFSHLHSFLHILSEDPLCWNWTFIIFSCFVLCAIIVERRHQVNEITESNEVCVFFYSFIIIASTSSKLCIVHISKWYFSFVIFFYPNRMLCGWQIRIIMAFN